MSGSTISSARTLIVPYPSAPPLFGAQETRLVWPEKSSAGILSYGMDLSDWVGSLNGAPYQVTSITVFPSGDVTDLAVSAGVVFGNIIGFTAASGFPGTLYSVELGVVCVDGSAESFIGAIPINYASPSVAPPIDLLPPGAPSMAVSLNNTAGSISNPFVITAQFTGFSVVRSPNNYCILPVNPGVPIVVMNQDVGHDPLIVLPPSGSVSVNGLPMGTSVEIPAPVLIGSVQQSTFIYGTVLTTPVQIEAF